MSSCLTLRHPDEEDIFGSDFESTDEETGQIDEQAGEKAVDEEEKRNRKVLDVSYDTTARANIRQLPLGQTNSVGKDDGCCTRSK